MSALSPTVPISEPISGAEPDMMMMSMRAGLALVLVLGLILLTRIILLRLQNGQIIGGRIRRLGVVEQMMIDGKNRLILIRRDQTEHLLVVGPEQIRLIETSIPPIPAAPNQQDQPA